MSNAFIEKLKRKCFKRFYQKIYEIESKEALYINNNILFFSITDKKLGKEIYDIITYLVYYNSYNKAFSFNLKKQENNLNQNSADDTKVTISFEGYTTSSKYCIESFWIRVTPKKILENFIFEKTTVECEFSNSQKFQVLVAFLEWMNNIHHYNFDYSRFEKEKTSSITEFLTFFSSRNKIQLSQNCIIKFFDKYYDEHCDEHNLYYNSSSGACPCCIKTKFFINNKIKENMVKVFEDLYAVHYRINEKYNLKVYKTKNIDISVAETQVDKIMNSSFDLFQECFIPHKKAFDDKKQFIGYIYDAVKFDDEESDIPKCDNIINTQKFKNLHRLKCLIRLILQIKEITKHNCGFINNPFTDVFLSKTYTKQVQILNIEFIRKNVSKEQTLKWTYEYVCKIIESDSSLEIDISNSNLDSILERMQILSKKLTKFCQFHNIYYNENHRFCPKCITPEDLKSIKSEPTYKYDFEEYIGEGGEAYIYPFGENYVAKIFKQSIDIDTKCIIIIKIWNKRKKLEEINKNNSSFEYIIPESFLVDFDNDEIFGYVMKKVNGIPISVLKDKIERRKYGITRKDVFNILIALGTGIQYLHDNGIYIGDLNGENIMYDLEKKKVCFVDFDGMGIDEIAPIYCTEQYIDPISKKNEKITMKDDWYSFAVQAFYYLTFTHPFNGRYSVVENGKKVNLDIPTKMERRISLLGNHGMTPPDIAESWHWMDPELKIAFRNIFEGETRKSIVPQLIKQYNQLYSGPLGADATHIIEKINYFANDAMRILSHYAKDGVRILEKYLE